ncbi:uncharacterized threonine-rich GPI-anchored glycoprotein PJ4664.02 isoform X2 [Manduca sexta]|uniref:uncharacterized threonine-rich GPI-anchored glycoprotein PJ4664.02 isoform X2 n=1 Tax=Manduca sexta TaxID=7130 RepID=UPI00188DCA64|nr:uncharacterized threonine-rich GPI-anchored glycoprotein PJ4664.02 isoform X2 [Manduca sexta]
MCEQTEIDYLDGEVVWVKLGSCWWPGEVIAPEKLPPDVLRSFRKPPIAVVKFFQEDKYEYVKNINFIYKYNCSRKNEFINKGLYMFRTKHGHMEKFPEDVIRAETAVGGDVEILTRDEFQETKKPSYAGLFGDPAKRTPGSGKSARGRPVESPSYTPVRKIKEKTDYKVHILVQGSKSLETSENTATEVSSTPSTSCAESEPQNIEDKQQTNNEQTEIVAKPVSNFSTPVASSSGIYSCHACSFTTSRLNVLILHNKSHSISFTPYTPSPVVKKFTPKSSSKTTPKVRRIRTEKKEKLPKIKSQGKKRIAENQSSENEVKKPKTDEEIKSSLLADWDDGDDESNDESTSMIIAGSPEVPVAAESPAVPTPAELPSAQMPAEISSPTEKKPDSPPSSDKPEACSDSKYEFCEDEDWPLETDAGRKIPRVKNPKRKDESKSLSLDEDDVAREVAELLNKTSVPELPSVPESLKVEENFPEPSIVKSPDKNPEKMPDKLPDNLPAEAQPSKAIFKTKTFFRSRHSRSQDAIGKYVAEQLNAVERMDISESEINGSEIVSSPEARESPPIEHVKVARLAPKIQLKKMKAEAAQLREKEKHNQETQLNELQEPYPSVDAISSSIGLCEGTSVAKEEESTEKPMVPILSPDVIYPTQEIKPVCSEPSETMKPLKLNYTESITGEPIVAKVKDNEAKLIKGANKENTDIIEKEEINHGTEKQPDNELPDLKFPESTLQKSYEPSIERYMNESTASAVDALLSVSRETDRVTRIISNDPPEELFEDDNKDNSINNNINGNHNENILLQNDYMEDKIMTDNTNNVEKETKDLNNYVALDAFVEDKKEVHLENKHNDEGNIAEDADIVSNEQVTVNNDKKENENIDESLPVVENLPAIENIPSESDLQIAETLINLPSTAIQSKTSSDHLENIQLPIPTEIPINQDEKSLNTNEDVFDEQISDAKAEIPSDNVNLSTDTLLITNNENIKFRYETEQEKSENLNAAQSLVQMSESVDHKINIIEPNVISSKKKSEPAVFAVKQNNGIDKTVEQKVALLSSENKSDITNSKSAKFETSSSKLLKILEEPCVPKPPLHSSPSQVMIPRKEKILNFDVAKSSLKGKPQSTKQKIIIRRTTPSKNVINNVNDITSSSEIILSRSNNPKQDGSSVQTYTIQTSPDTPSDTNTIIIQQKIRKITKPPTKLQKIKPHNSLVAPLNEPKIPKATPADDTIFDINSMPIVLSEDLLTPESIEKMPVVMSDGNIISHTPINPPKLVKSKQSPVECEKIPISATPNKPEVKTLLMNPVTEVSNVTTPNILSKSSKLRGAKTMLLIDKTTGKQKIIMTKPEPPVKEVKQPTTVMQSVSSAGKTEKFIILPTPSSPRPSRAQKIVIDPQTGKAHVLVAKSSEPQPSPPENKPVSAKLIASQSDTNAPGNTVMIITNAQGAQSRILLTPEHEKILFPNKQQANISQLKTIAQRITTNTQKTIVNTGTTIKSQTATHTKTQTRIVPKQKNAIITSKGQLIVGGRVATTSQNIAPMPETRPAPKRIVAAEPKKLVQAIQKTTTEPLIFLQQKSGAMMQLTAAQFEHMQKTGQIVQRSTVPVQENKILVQKQIPIPANEPPITTVQKTRIRKTVSDSPTPVKKMKQEIAIAPAPVRSPSVPVPALTPISNTTATSILPPVSNTVSIATSASYPEYDNFEELLPSTAIARQSEPSVMQAEQTAAPPQASLSDGQLLAVPGEPFGGPPGSFYLCVEDNGTLTPIDHRPLILENNQLVPMAVEPLPVLAPQPERRDILEAALANSDVFHADTPRDEAPDFRDLNANVSVHCRVSETSTTLNQPIMTPVEMPTKVDSEPAVPSNLEDGLAVIGVTPHTVPTSLELPITVTDPRIAPKTTDPLSGANYGTTLLPSPNTEMSFVTAEETDVPMVGPISMPLLTEEESVGKSMPILTDEVTERTVSSVESTIGSPSSIDVRESETEDGSQWTRRLLTPGSDISEASVEIPLQPAIQLSVNDMSHHS